MIITFGILAALCIGYYLYIISYGGLNSAFATFWLIGGLVCAVIAIGINLLKKKHYWEAYGRYVKITLASLIGMGMCFLIVMLGLVASKMNDKPEEKADVLIVLGAQVHKDSPSKSLAKRLDAAYEYLVDNNETKVVVSGGQGSNEVVTEASVMKTYLMNKGIEENRIIVEDNSTSTKENLLYSYAMIKQEFEDSAHIAVVTNNFHMFRAEQLAKKLGISNIEGLASSADNTLLVNYMMREVFALVKEWSLGNI